MSQGNEEEVMLTFYVAGHEDFYIWFDSLDPDQQNRIRQKIANEGWSELQQKRTDLEQVTVELRELGGLFQSIEPLTGELNREIEKKVNHPSQNKERE
jgi:hypothetical protein